MGCCESKLLVAPLSDFQPCPKQLASISLYKPELALPSLTMGSDKCSLGSLKQQLEGLINIFQNEKGPITCTFISKSSREIQRFDQQNQEDDQKMEKMQNQYQMESNIESGQWKDTSYSNQNLLDDDQQSLFCQNNSKFLTNAQIATRTQLQKELFYIDSGQIGNVNLQKWTEKDRKSVAFVHNELMQAVRYMNLITFASGIVQIYFYEMKTNLKLLSLKQSSNSVGLRVFINGIKRMLLLDLSPNCSVVSLMKQIPQKFVHLDNLQMSTWVYVLTGWIPEIINLSMFPDTSEIFRRLISNYLNGNIVIGFSNELKDEFLLIKDVDHLLRGISVVRIKKGLRENVIKEEDIIEWGVIAKKYPFLNVNWNPLIYSFHKKMEGRCSLSINSKGQLKRQKMGYVVSIPPSKAQVEVRILVQVHCTSHQNINQKLLVKLYEYNGGKLNIDQRIPIRTCHSTTGLFISEIFIFEKSTQQSHYIVTIQVDDDSFLDENIQITIDYYTFCQITAKEMKQPQVTQSKEIVSIVSPSCAGFGMNSAFYTRNLQYALKVQKGALCKINVRSDTNEQFNFELCLLPDEKNCEDLSMIKPEEIVKFVVQSQQFENQGSFEFKATLNHYILILVCYSPTHGKAFINADFYSTSESHKKFNIQQIYFNPQFSQEFQFQWRRSNPGPRKRTKHNCDPIYYPIEAFKKFFENPYVDFHLPEGLYQFSLVSKTFINSFLDNQLLMVNQFSKQQECDKILNAVPPSLSMGIFQLVKGKSEAKIILDDYEYVPYGIGFWSSPLKLEGLHRFVFSKMEKGDEEGIFRIRKLTPQ